MGAWAARPWSWDEGDSLQALGGGACVVRMRCCCTQAFTLGLAYVPLFVDGDKMRDCRADPAWTPEFVERYGNVKGVTLLPEHLPVSVNVNNCWRAGERVRRGCGGASTRGRAAEARC